MEKTHYLYEIKNKINGKIYIGIHSTKNINDGYMGSGTLIIKAIEKYGLNNFSKTILEYCNSREELIELEKQVVNQEFVNNENTYNLVVGGSNLNCSWGKTNEIISNKLKNDPNWRNTRNQNISLGVRRAIKNGKCSTATKEFQLIRNKKSLTEESIKKRKESYKRNKHQQGENHALYGKKIINNCIEWKWILKSEIEEYLKDGWKLGKGNSTKRS